MAEQFLNKTGLQRLWTQILTKLNTKVDKVSGKGLSTNDYTDAEKAKVATIGQGTAGADASIYSKNSSNKALITTDLTLSGNVIQGSGSTLSIKPISTGNTLNITSAAGGISMSGLVSPTLTSGAVNKGYIDGFFNETVIASGTLVSSGSSWSSAYLQTYTLSQSLTAGRYARLKIVAAKPSSTSYTIYLCCGSEIGESQAIIPFSDTIITVNRAATTTTIQVGVQSKGGTSTTISSITYEIITPSKILDFIYPVDSIWTGYSYETYPAKVFGGQWTQIQDKFLLAAGQSYNVNATGGEATHTLTTSEMPQHTHALKFGGGDADQTIVAGRSYVQSTRWWWSSTDEALIQAAGGSAAHNNMPPYLAVSVWRRIG